MGSLYREVFLIQGEDQKSPSPDATPSPLWRTPLRARCALGWWICAADVARLVRGSPCPPLYETPAQVMLRLGEGAGTRPWGRWDPQCDWQTLGPRLSPRLGRRAPTLLSARILWGSGVLALCSGRAHTERWAERLGSETKTQYLSLSFLSP